MGHVAGPELDGRSIPFDVGLNGMVSQKKDFIGKRSLSKDAFVAEDRQTIVGLVPLDKKSKIPEGSRLSRDDKIRKIVNNRSDLAVKAYIDLSKKYDIDPVHLALAFCNERPFMGSVIFGATNSSQLKKILVGLDIKLNNEILDIHRCCPPYCID